MLRQEIVSDAETRLVVSGPLYGEAAIELEKKIEALCAGSFATISLDFSMAVGITSSIIGKLVSAQKRLVEQKRNIRIVGCSTTLYETFQKIKLDSIIQITK